jgi:hypothetical protein
VISGLQSHIRIENIERQKFVTVFPGDSIALKETKESQHGGFSWAEDLPKGIVLPAKLA